MAKQNPTQENLEYALASNLLTKLSTGKITKLRASQIAKEILEIIPAKSPEGQLKKLLEKLMQDCPEIAEACLNLYNEVENQETQAKIKLIQKQIRIFHHDRTQNRNTNQTPSQGNSLITH